MTIVTVADSTRDLLRFVESIQQAQEQVGRFILDFYKSLDAAQKQLAQLRPVLEMVQSTQAVNRFLVPCLDDVPAPTRRRTGARPELKRKIGFNR
jgi:hypothetical protein